MRRTALALIAMAVMSACAATTGSKPSPTTTPTPTPAATPTASPIVTPTPTPSPSPVPPEGFVCTSTSGGLVASSTVTAVRVGQHPGYDRFVIEFGGGVPAYSVTLQTSTTFQRSPKGDTVVLEGTSGVLVTIHSVTNWTAYAGPVAFHPGYPYLRQAIMVENYEGYQRWALGIQGSACIRVAMYSSPDRLVVDVAAA